MPGTAGRTIPRCLPTREAPATSETAGSDAEAAQLEEVSPARGGAAIAALAGDGPMAKASRLASPTASAAPSS